MKNLNIYLILLLVTVSFSNCEIDNFQEPDASIEGRILDANGVVLQTEQGGGNMRIKMEELSWAGDDTTIAIVPFYLNVKQDGSFNNSKIFSGEYRITPVNGPFYPYNEEGKIVNINGPTVIDFEVTPYLNIEWVTEPYLTEDNKIAAEVRFTRNMKDTLIAPALGDAQLFISTTKYCGNNNYVDTYVGRNVAIKDAQEGETILFEAIRPIKYGEMTYYVRVGINCKDAYKAYNYTDIKTVVVGKLPE